jgi:PPOX class probable F420-dependent enzyme
MLNLDLHSEFGQRVVQRLREERIGWLITVDAQGTPQPKPVWFWWEDDSILIYSQPNTAKLRHIGRHPQVALHLDGDGAGGNIVVVTGAARIDETAPPADQHAAYRQKYTWGFQRLHKTAAEFAQLYSVPIWITALKVRGH